MNTKNKFSKSKMIRFGIWYDEFGWKIAFLISIIVSIAIVLSPVKVSVIILTIWVVIAIFLGIISSRAKRWLADHNF